MATDATPESPDIVADAGPLIHLDELECLDLLNDFPSVSIPIQVWDEVLRHRSQALSDPPKFWLRRHVEIPHDEEFRALVKTFGLDLGEQAALTLMREYPRGVFVTDDTAARLAAKALGYRAHGSLGILLRSIRRRMRTKVQVLELLHALPRISTLHLRDDLREEIIRAVDEGTDLSF